MKPEAKLLKLMHKGILSRSLHTKTSADTVKSLFLYIKLARLLSFSRFIKFEIYLLYLKYR